MDTWKDVLRMGQKMVKEFVPCAVGVGLSALGYNISENVYSRFNALRPVAEFLHNPDYLTSFAYPLTLMYSLRFVISMGIDGAELVNNPMLAEIYKKAVLIIPVAVMGLDILYEATSKPTYADHPILDVLACSLAMGVYFGAEILTNKNKQPATVK
jgi:heme exporter protein D